MKDDYAYHFISKGILNANGLRNKELCILLTGLDEKKLTEASLRNSIFAKTSQI